MRPPRRPRSRWACCWWSSCSPVRLHVVCMEDSPAGRPPRFTCCGSLACERVQPMSALSCINLKYCPFGRGRSCATAQVLRNVRTAGRCWGAAGGCGCVRDPAGTGSGGSRQRSVGDRRAGKPAAGAAGRRARGGARQPSALLPLLAECFERERNNRICFCCSLARNGGVLLTWPSAWAR